MKKFFLFHILIGLSVCTLAQELRKVTRQPDPGTTEEYYVLKSDKNVKHGLYRKTIQSKRRVVGEGYYKMGKKDSLWKRAQDGVIQKIGTYKQDQKHGIWITYGGITADTQIVRDSGAYDMGKKVGIWKYYDREGEPDLIYDYDEGKSLFQKKDTLQYVIIVDKDTLATTLDHSPVYKDGWDQFYYTMANNLRFNNYLFSKTLHLKSKIYIAFYINEFGEMEELRAISKTDKDLNQMAIAAIEANNKSNWLPGIYQGKAVKTQLIVPLDFTNYGVVNRRYQTANSCFGWLRSLD